MKKKCVSLQIPTFICGFIRSSTHEMRVYQQDRKQIYVIYVMYDGALRL